jgi:hypothetical protein
LTISINSFVAPCKIESVDDITYPPARNNCRKSFQKALSEEGPAIITSRKSPAIFPATSILAAEQLQKEFWKLILKESANITT